MSGLTRALGLKGSGIVAAYGAGGKSALLAALAQELALSQKKVIITTTTKIYRPADIPCIIATDLPQALSQLEEAFLLHSLVALGTSSLPGGKLAGIAADWLPALLQSSPASHILVEADGAAGKSAKGHAAHEPALPAAADLIIPVLGLDAIGLALLEGSVHRPKLLASMLSAGAGTCLDEGHLADCMRHMVRLGLSQSPQATVVPVFNKADTVSDSGIIGAITEKLQGLPDADRLLYVSARDNNPVKFIMSRRDNQFLPAVTCVVLAAGSSQRMGTDKMQIKIGQRTMLEHAVNNALASGADEVVLVVRPDYPTAGYLTSGKVRQVINPDHLQGQSSSLRAGLAAVAGNAQAVIFALGDQPFIPPAVFAKLIGHYRRTLPLAAYPEYLGQRGNPVLFDRRVFPLLEKLQGDSGGRQIIGQMPAGSARAVPVSCSGVLADIDTSADLTKYARLMENNCI